MEANKTDFRAIGATTYLCPTPTVLIGCAEDDGWKMGGETKPNLVTVAWTGICCTKPPMIGISVRPERYSHGLISRTGEFTVNLVNETLLYAMDYCGVKSGRDVDKFHALNLRAVSAPALEIAPALAQAPAFLSCKVRQVIPLGSHDLFLAEIMEVSVGDAYFRADGSIDEQAMKLVAFVHGKYRVLGAELGFFGYSVAGKETLKRRLPAGTRKRAAGGEAKTRDAESSPRTARSRAKTSKSTSVPAHVKRGGKA